MNADQAKLELDATTLRPQDASAEARAMAEADPQLAAWLAERTAFDESLSAAMAPIAVPAGLRESILRAAAAGTAQRKSTSWLKPWLLAAAACLTLGTTVLLSTSGHSDSWQNQALSAVMSLEHGTSLLDEEKDTLAEIRQSLAASGSVSPQKLPATLEAAQALGCKRVKIGSHPASIICFMLESGKEAHIVVMNTSELPSSSTPQFASEKDWNTATWSDGQQTFFLATTDDVAALKKLVGQG
jgi:hypothetical protein